MPNKPRVLAELAVKLGKDEKTVLVEALEQAGSIDGAAFLLSQWRGERVWTNSVRSELKRFGLDFQRTSVGRIIEVVPDV